MPSSTTVILPWWLQKRRWNWRRCKWSPGLSFQFPSNSGWPVLEYGYKLLFVLLPLRLTKIVATFFGNNVVSISLCRCIYNNDRDAWTCYWFFVNQPGCTRTPLHWLGKGKKRKMLNLFLNKNHISASTLVSKVSVSWQHTGKENAEKYED